MVTLRKGTEKNAAANPHGQEPATGVFTARESSGQDVLGADDSQVTVAVDPGVSVPVEAVRDVTVRIPVPGQGGNAQSGTNVKPDSDREDTAVTAILAGAIKNIDDIPDGFGNDAITAQGGPVLESGDDAKTGVWPNDAGSGTVAASGANTGSDKIILTPPAGAKPSLDALLDALADDSEPTAVTGDGEIRSLLGDSDLSDAERTALDRALQDNDDISAETTGITNIVRAELEPKLKELGGDWDTDIPLIIDLAKETSEELGAAGMPIVDVVKAILLACYNTIECKTAYSNLLGDRPIMPPNLADILAIAMPHRDNRPLPGVSQVPGGRIPQPPFAARLVSPPTIRTQAPGIPAQSKKSKVAEELEAKLILLGETNPEKARYFLNNTFQADSVSLDCVNECKNKRAYKDLILVLNAKIILNGDMSFDTVQQVNGCAALGKIIRKKAASPITLKIAKEILSLAAENLPTEETKAAAKNELEKLNRPPLRARVLDVIYSTVEKANAKRKTVMAGIRAKRAAKKQESQEEKALAEEKARIEAETKKAANTGGDTINEKIDNIATRKHYRVARLFSDVYYTGILGFSVYTAAFFHEKSRLAAGISLAVASAVYVAFDASIKKRQNKK